MSPASLCPHITQPPVCPQCPPEPLSGPGVPQPLSPSRCPQELVALAKFILGKFFALAATNKKAFVELLFWKSPAAVCEMTKGYGSLQEGEG